MVFNRANDPFLFEIGSDVDINASFALRETRVVIDDVRA